MIDLRWTIESAVARDLPGINRVLATAINAWTVSERVKRLALPLYHYELADLEDLHIYKAVDTQGVILGVIAWGAVAPAETLFREGEALLNGIYVDPAFQGLGIGKSLFEYARQRAEGFGYRGFIVKASKDAIGFFERIGLDRVESDKANYPYLFWKAFDSNPIQCEN